MDKSIKASSNKDIHSREVILDFYEMVYMHQIFNKIRGYLLKYVLKSQIIQIKL